MESQATRLRIKPPRRRRDGEQFAKGKNAETDTRFAAEPISLPLSQLMVKRKISAAGFAKWTQQWTEGLTGRELYAIAKTPQKDIQKLHIFLPKAASSLIVQIRTGKIGLRKFSVARKVPGFDNPRCQCGRGKQSAQHMLTICPKFVKIRKEKWAAEKTRLPFGYLPGAEMLVRPGYAKISASFMKDTRLLNQFQLAKVDQA